MNLLEKDKRYCWHPFTQHQTERNPVVVTRAKGTCLYTEEGDEILDMISSWWTCTHGHAHPEINKALVNQADTMEHVMFAGFAHPNAANLSEKLASVLPGDLNRVFFSDNGSTAVEVAVKIAYQYWVNKGQENRKKFIAFDGAYHGDTIGAMSVGQGCGFFNIYEDLMFSIEALPYPHTWDNDAEVDLKEKAALSALKNLIEKSGDEIAALIVEPLMQGAGGIRFSRLEFMKQIVSIAQQADILVIFDEVAVGFGRTGDLFACQKIGCTPDLICLSKGLTAGYMPMSVTVATDRIFEAFNSDSFKTAFLHGHSFTANPLACAVALRSLELFEQENTLDHIAHIEKQHKGFLAKLSNHPMVTMPRVMGSIMAFNLPEGGGYKSDLSEKLRDWFLSNGLNIRPIGSTVYLMPPYCITDEQLSRAYDGIIAGLSAVNDMPSNLAVKCA